MSSDLENKDYSIKSLIEYLLKKYGESNIKVKDYWEGDNCAVGITDAAEKFLVYISTFSLDKTGYYIALENPSTNDEMPYEPAGEFDSLSLSELEDKLREHLRVR